MSKGRLVVTYADGSWTDHLSMERFGLHNDSEGLTLRIDVKPRVRVPRGLKPARVLAEFISKRQAVHTIQIGAVGFASALRSRLRALESARLGLCLSVGGADTRYPVAVVFGPDEIILNVG